MVRFVALAALVALAVGTGCKKRDPATPAAETKAPTGGPGERPPVKGQNPPTKTPAPQRTEFFNFNSPDGTFKASFPWAGPFIRTRTQGTPFGQVTDTCYEVVSGSKSASVYVSDWSGPQQKNANLEEVASTGANAVAQSFGGAVAKNTRTAFGENVIREVTIDFPGRAGQGPAYFRYYIHGRRLYTVAILIDRGTVPDADRDKFFDSFKILK